MKIGIPKSLLKKDIVEEKNLINKSLDELLLLKDEEHDFLSINIPILVAMWVAMIPVSQLGTWTTIGVTSLVWIFLSVNMVEAHKTSRKNIRTYNEVIFKKLKEQKDKEEKYKKEISGYLKQISESIKN